ncbi:MAG: pyridoxal phosphate-dependent aminotransferase [Anaerolineales bacterium]|nr:pyridoxal phosphate-dependent aminotransferase [Anaerolineales bacterium]
MSLTISSRSSQIVQSEIRNMSIECDRVGGINLSQGICDLELPLPVRLGAQEAMIEGINHYTRYDGLLELRQAIAEKTIKYNHIQTDPEKNITVSGGSTGAFYCACLALLNPGDEVIIFEPYYGYHINTLIAANVNPVYVPLEPPDWSFSIQDLEKIITPRTKGIMVNTPANPCGKVFSQDELEQIADFAVRHQLFVFTDEIYEYFVYDGRKHISPGSIQSIADQTITISGYSKTFSITGWRIGYAVCHEKWAQMIGYVNDLFYVCAPAPLQLGVARGINELPAEFYEALCEQYYVKRNKLCQILTDIGITPFVPQGAYYVLADVSRLPGKTSKDKAMYLLQKTGVATVPGEAFYSHHRGQNLVRFCFAKDNAIIDEACQRLKGLT